MSDAALTGTHFMMGNIACAEGAIAAGCRFFAGYPITPASEIAHHMSRRQPKIGGRYIQMEDEIGSMAAILGAAHGGMKSMTATSGPGLCLMVENIGLGFMTETPCVVVNVQRGGPSTGLPTLTSQGDMMQARWGSHGDHEMIAYVPASVQEMFDLTVRAFNTACRYRTPVLVLADQVLGHMSGRVVIPPAEDIEVVDVARPVEPPGPKYLPYAGNGSVPPLAVAGEGYRVHVTGLTHDERGYPDMTPGAQQRLIGRLVGKVRDHIDDIAEMEGRHLDDAEWIVVCYGSTSRAAWRAVKAARAEGLRWGWLRLVTAWPFPYEAMADSLRGARGVLVPEVNFGQMVHPVRESTQRPVHSLCHGGGDMLRPDAILDRLRDLAARTAPSNGSSSPPGAPGDGSGNGQGPGA